MDGKNTGEFLIELRSKYSKRPRLDLIIEIIKHLGTYDKISVILDNEESLAIEAKVLLEVINAKEGI